MMQSKVTADRIPEKYVNWFVSSRVKMLNEMKEGKPLRYFSAHLPIMCTWLNNPDQQTENTNFPVNMTVKGIGLIPEKEYLTHYTDIFEATLANFRSEPWQDSLNKRVDAMCALYAKNTHFNDTLMGGLEIFEGRAFKNLRENPFASLLYVGMNHTSEGMEYISFQINGEVEILEKDNPYYNYLLQARKLFEFDKFHIYQPDYPYGYLIRVREVIDKSPWSRKNK
ncbi:pyridoxamine 5'-phosphate oxidase-like FMN-binding protein [Candidatus Magnetoovum chiemensis]|nr:pyridoxamine 5'-phosphate oxidase-like FMN-binding protein [Candidatus Magnetoovum chiemensis]